MTIPNDRLAAITEAIILLLRLKPIPDKEGREFVIRVLGHLRRWRDLAFRGLEPL